jgi:hypothetical protein
MNPHFLSLLRRRGTENAGVYHRGAPSKQMPRHFAANKEKVLLEFSVLYGSNSLCGLI